MSPIPRFSLRTLILAMMATPLVIATLHFSWCTWQPTAAIDAQMALRLRRVQVAPAHQIEEEARRVLREEVRE